MSYRKHDIQVYDKASKHRSGNAVVTKEKISPNSIQKEERRSRNNFGARLNFPTNLVTSFNANHLKYMFEPTDAAYKAMGREESQVNYWDDESNNFYEALNLAFSDDLEKMRQSDIGVKETKVFSSGQTLQMAANWPMVVQVPLLGGRHCMAGGQMLQFLPLGICS